MAHILQFYTKHFTKKSNSLGYWVQRSIFTFFNSWHTICPPIFVRQSSENGDVPIYSGKVPLLGTTCPCEVLLRSWKTDVFVSQYIHFIKSPLHLSVVLLQSQNKITIQINYVFTQIYSKSFMFCHKDRFLIQLFKKVYYV